jgi:imidazolonepropionase-like amidohydrolase
VIAGGKIRAAGSQASTPVPKGAETINGKGKVVRPMPYTGSIKEGEPASFMIFDAETGTPEGIMRDGEWVR